MANEKPEWVDIGGIGRTGASYPLFYGEPAWGDDILQISKLDFSGRNEMKILVACEESQAVTKAFRARGHEAYSCDVEPCSGGHPEWHIQGDVLPLLNGRCFFNTADGALHSIDDRWDMILAFPPCTFTSNAAARFLYPKGILNIERMKKGVVGRDFFMRIYNADCDKIVIENPTPSKIYCFPKKSQSIQPWEHGHPYSKLTNLWIKGVPLLTPTNILSAEHRQSTKVAGNWFNKGGKDRQKNRAKTFQGIAGAMASQWSEDLTKKEIPNEL